MPTGKEGVSGGYAVSEKLSLNKNDRDYISNSIKKNRESSLTSWTASLERNLINEIEGTIGFAKALDKTPVPTATEQKKKLKKIQLRASQLLVEIQGGVKRRGNSDVLVPALGYHTGVVLHRALRRLRGYETGFTGLRRRIFVDLLDDIANSRPLELVTASRHSEPFRQYLLDELAHIWLDYTGTIPDGVSTDPETGWPFGKFYDWAQFIFGKVFEKDAPRERVAEAISKLKK